jgi:LytR cell envelope-related transcriptional attenuator
VVLGAVVLVVAIFALREPKGHVSAAAKSGTITRTVTPTSTHSSAKSTASSTAKHPTKSKSGSSSSSSSPTTGSGVKSVPLVVLNNTTTSGLAKEAAQRFERGGWTVTKYDNYSNDIVSTCAYYDPSVQGAQAAAEALQQQYPTIQRVQPKFSGLDFGPVVVILTPGYSP